MCSLIYLSWITVLDAIRTTPFADELKNVLLRNKEYLEETSEYHQSSTEEKGIFHAKSFD